MSWYKVMNLLIGPTTHVPSQKQLRYPSEELKIVFHLLKVLFFYCMGNEQPIPANKNFFRKRMNLDWYKLASCRQAFVRAVCSCTTERGKSDHLDVGWPVMGWRVCETKEYWAGMTGWQRTDIWTFEWSTFALDKLPIALMFHLDAHTWQIAAQARAQAESSIRPASNSRKSGTRHKAELEFIMLALSSERGFAIKIDHKVNISKAGPRTTSFTMLIVLISEMELIFFLGVWCSYSGKVEAWVHPFVLKAQSLLAWVLMDIVDTQSASGSQPNSFGSQVPQFYSWDPCSHGMHIQPQRFQRAVQQTKET